MNFCMCYLCMYVCKLFMQVCILCMYVYYICIYLLCMCVCMYIMYVCMIFYMYIHVLFFSSFLRCNLIEIITENNIYLFRCKR